MVEVRSGDGSATKLHVDNEGHSTPGSERWTLVSRFEREQGSIEDGIEAVELMEDLEHEDDGVAILLTATPPRADELGNGSQSAGQQRHGPRIHKSQEIHDQLPKLLQTCLTSLAQLRDQRKAHRVAFDDTRQALFAKCDSLQTTLAELRQARCRTNPALDLLNEYITSGLEAQIEIDGTSLAESTSTLGSLSDELASMEEQVARQEHQLLSMLRCSQATDPTPRTLGSLEESSDSEEGSC